MTNNPSARYFKLRPNSTTIPNGEYPLWKVVRASTAAPYFFAPEKITIKTGDTQRGLKGVVGEFVDGGVTTANNPALAMVLMMILRPQGLLGLREIWELPWIAKRKAAKSEAPR